MGGHWVGGHFPKTVIEAVRDAADIVQVVSEYVPLKRAGSRWKGICPFHQEKTPSFSVDPTNQLFYCFGCGTGGDLFKFVMLYDKLDFPEVVETIARRFGVPLPEPDPRVSRTTDKRERLFAINRDSADFYAGLLRGDAGARCRAYLERRGLDQPTIERLGLGYAPDSWDALARQLAARRYGEDELLEAGLVVQGKSGRGVYDRFRDRLIFPIRDVRGRTVAFGGRAIGDAEPKYINSPETPTYTKGDQLYGLDLARDAIRREGFAVVVEGYLDLAALLQAGIDQVVASLGTAFTAAQSRLLARYTDRVLVSYDGDAAGAEATTRSLDLLLEKGFEVRVVELPAGKDPDDFVRDEGPGAYERLLRQAPEYLEFLIRRQQASRDLSRPQEKVAAVNAVLPHLAKLGTSIERSEWAGRLADTLQVDDELVLAELRGAARAARASVRQPVRDRPSPRWSEGLLVRLLLENDEQRARFAERTDLDDDIESMTVAQIVKTIRRLIDDGTEVSYRTVLQSLSDEADRELLTGIAFRDDPVEGTIDDCLWVSERDRLRRLQREAVRRLGELEGESPAGDSAREDVDEMLARVQEIARQRDALY
ncbi:MAG TPA: DNA primase [Candidatus Polarisedimenticolaceae bacterium]|nr:DNA primase [Candidatus Polarisedimenticolaceae bacterium]